MKRQIIIFATAIMPLAFFSCSKEKIERNETNTNEEIAAKPAGGGGNALPGSLTKNLEGLYQFDGNLKEQTGKLAAAVPSTAGADVYTEDRNGVANNAIHFNGRYGIDIPGIPLEINFSIAAWVKYDPSIAPVSTNYFIKSDAVSPWVAQDGSEYKGVISTPNTSNVSSGNMDGHWHYLVATYDGTALKFYVDGSYMGNSLNNAGGVYPPGFSVNYQIGYTTFPFTKDIASVWYGSVDDLRFYSRVLSAVEVQKLYSL